MASGEVALVGAAAWLVGDCSQGFKQMAEMVNQSRLSNGYALNGHRCGAPFMRPDRGARQASLRPAPDRFAADAATTHQDDLLPTEAALSVAFFTADCLERADAGDAEAQTLRRILTPLIKLRACRDARKVTGDAMEMRGGNGYIEEWIEPRLLREAHLGSIWEGTSNIIALDVVRAAGKAAAHRLLEARLEAMLTPGPSDLAAALQERLGAVLALLERAGPKMTPTQRRRVKPQPAFITPRRRRCSCTRRRYCRIPGAWIWRG